MSSYKYVNSSFSEPTHVKQNSLLMHDIKSMKTVVLKNKRDRSSGPCRAE